MTIAVAIKVRDGIVLGADSASTLSDPVDEPIAGDGGEEGKLRRRYEVANIYNHANKIVNLCKGKPIGFITWGRGGFGQANIATLAKDFRADVWPDEFGGADDYTVQAVAERLRSFLMEVEENATGPFGFVVAGHSPGQMLGEAWVVQLDEEGEWSDPAETLPGEVGIAWWGQPRWIQRLVLGIDVDGVAQALVDGFGLPEERLGDAINAIRSFTETRFVHPAMPIQDAIHVASFFVDLTKQATEFTPGHLVVGGPTEIAAITKHEGFKWVARKHYYNSTLNPPSLEGP